MTTDLAPAEAVKGEVLDVLTPEEQARLPEDEAAIEQATLQGLAAVCERGRCLEDIRERGLVASRIPGESARA
jgi:hypothetical protein